MSPFLLHGYVYERIPSFLPSADTRKIPLDSYKIEVYVVKTVMFFSKTSQRYLWSISLTCKATTAKCTYFLHCGKAFALISLSLIDVSSEVLQFHWPFWICFIDTESIMKLLNVSNSNYSILLYVLALNMNKYEDDRAGGSARVWLDILVTI